ncbi:DUF7553 family protein [Haloterrigena alkaliphila]|uniref:Uncharacterized protein n=1 Tax=Haloterrigena alkaliphila TaxID=2816475 RepID=A0A8A2VDE9_9EURY|nr:hypothetical protein [Haloterrigena alkaliphila]QSW99256.1 hypothetical protein J0X25_18060 [Haloterrigena alkaliphila]
MNKHFHDSRYYLARAADHAKLGLTETLEPAVSRVRGLGRDDEPEPEPTRLESVRGRLSGLERAVSGRVGSARAVVSRDGSDAR